MIWRTPSEGDFTFLMKRPMNIAGSGRWPSWGAAASAEPFQPSGVFIAYFSPFIATSIVRSPIFIETNIRPPFSNLPSTGPGAKRAAWPPGASALFLDVDVQV